MVLVSRQSALHNQDFNFQFNKFNESARTISDKRIIHLLNLKELHLEHISTLPVCHQGLNRELLAHAYF